MLRFLPLPPLAFLLLTVGLISVSHASDADHTTAEALHPIAETAASKLTDVNEPFVMTVQFFVKPDCVEGFLAAMKEPLLETVKETGNRAYELSQNPLDETQFLLYEKWAHVEALNRHLNQPYLAKLGAALGDLLTVDPVINHYTPIE
ncbi:putative quinol monooxygenase [Botrimarina hoheduenensis]|uniref:Autoinducer-2 (AI-2) modifying protein LsrG n=1 Tax=Botrimarina hoheduenensis TaxID=2528000 RepID=A0A5C5VZ33_9BACT|nr:putative quinol monooxygenase [Botrimarina hoheduenensis]TWT43337.1 autoinducer-2 (AI-2) modifying protein LsrG [Botrimarina hoheduenensis]